jgi:hypothetical protein
MDLETLLKEDLTITDPAHALNMMQSDLKLAKVSQYADLIFDLTDAGDGFSDPDLYISLNDTKPTLKDFDLACTFYGEDICILSGKELENRALNLN